MAEIVPGSNEDEAILNTCNLGDSAYLLVRPSLLEGQNAQIDSVFRSKSQQHRFNAPYQTGTEKTWPTKAFETHHIVK